MEQKREIRTVFNESTFTNLCKNGFLVHNGISGKVEVSFTSLDIKTLISGKILEKELDDVVLKFILQDIGLEMIKEILKRSPIYSNISFEI